MKYSLGKPIKTVAYALRPRERLISNGAGNIETEELLAILLGTGRKGANVTSVAREILHQYPLQILRNTHIEKLCAIAGIQKAKAASIFAALEFGKRAWEKESEFPPLIESPEDVISFVYSLGKDKKESVAGLYLNVQNRIIHNEIISVGILDASLIHPREIFSPAISHHAAGVILVHNHPSGDTTPSPEDMTITSQLIEAGHILGIPLLDHLVIGKNGYTSIRGLNQHNF